MDEGNSFWDKVENGIWEPYTLKIFDNYINKNTTMLDIGAEIGATTLYPACNAKRIYAVEPSVVAFKKLSCKRCYIRGNLVEGQGFEP